jgi:protein tyrosine phosphatase (PTP) superfamily phosphohydrolase (DUF442 family)
MTLTVGPQATRREMYEKVFEKGVTDIREQRPDLSCPTQPVVLQWTCDPNRAVMM